MQNEFEKRIADALRQPQNMGAMDNADAVGMVGSPGCGEMLKMWIKFKEQNGKKVIDRASFQSFGCETAIAVASLATELIKGKTAAEAISLSGQQLAGELGPLPPMKIHCSQLVEEALRNALEPAPRSSDAAPPSGSPSALLDSFSQASRTEGAKLVLLPNEPSPKTGRRDEPAG